MVKLHNKTPKQTSWPALALFYDKAFKIKKPFSLPDQ